MSLLVTFNEYTASGVLSFFQNIIFMFQNIISGSEHKCTLEHLRKKKQTKNERRKKTIEEKQTILLERMKRRR